MNDLMWLGWVMSCAFAVAGFALFWDAVWALGIQKQWHHAWIGVALMVQPWVWWLWPIGFYILIDDARQHHRQRRDPLYLSPLHRFYVGVYQWVNGER